MKRTSPVIRNIVIALITAAISGFYVMTGHATRDYPDIDFVHSQIAQINEAIKVAEQKEDLPRLEDTWQSINVIAKTYGVTVTPLKSAQDAGLTDADIPGGTPWFGAIQGKTKDVAVAAIEIQKVVPIIYGAAALDNQVIGLSFAALGSEQAK